MSTSGHEPTAATADGATATAQDWKLLVALLCIWDYDAYVQAANPAYRVVFGWSDEALMAVPFWEFVHPDEQHAAVKSGQQLMDGVGSVYGYEVRLLRSDGAYRWTCWNTCAFPRDHLLLGIGIDVTGSREHTADRVQVGTWDWRFRTDTVTLSGDLFGLPERSPVPGEKFLAQVHVKDRLSLNRGIRWSLASGQPLAEDVRLTQHDGSLRRIRLAGRVTKSPEGDPARMLGIARAGLPVGVRPDPLSRRSGLRTGGSGNMALGQVERKWR